MCITTIFWALILVVRFSILPAADAEPTLPQTIAERLAAARAAYAAGDWARAETLFQALVDEQPGNGNLQFELGRVHYRLEKFASAWEHFQAAESHQATALHLALWTGFTAFKLERWEDTERYLGRVDATEITDEVQLKRAIAQFNLGRPEAARALTELAAQDSPAGRVARYYSALMDENAGEPAAAFDLYDRLLGEGEPFQSAAYGRLRALQAPPWTFRLELAGGYESRPARLNDDSNRNGEAPDAFGQASCRFACRPFYAVGPITPVIYWLSVGGYLREYSRSHRLDYALVTLAQTLENSPERAINFRIENAFRRHWLGHAPFFDEGELSGAVQWRTHQEAFVSALTAGLSGALTQDLGPSYAGQAGLQGIASTGYAFVWNQPGGWRWSCALTVAWQQRSADDAAESYRQGSVQLAPSVTVGQRVMISASIEMADRTYRPDNAKGGQIRREWPTTCTAAIETPLWAHTSLQAHLQLVEQGSNQAANRYTNRQAWLSFYCWF